MHAPGLAIKVFDDPDDCRAQMQLIARLDGNARWIFGRDRVQPAFSQHSRAVGAALIEQTIRAGARHEADFGMPASDAAIVLRPVVSEGNVVGPNATHRVGGKPRSPDADHRQEQIKHPLLRRAATDDKPETARLNDVRAFHSSRLDLFKDNGESLRGVPSVRPARDRLDLNLEISRNDAFHRFEALDQDRPHVGQDDPKRPCILESRGMHLHDHDRPRQHSRATSGRHHTLLNSFDHRGAKIEHRGVGAEIHARVEHRPNALDDGADHPVRFGDNFSRRITPAFRAASTRSPARRAAAPPP